MLTPKHDLVSHLLHSKLRAKRHLHSFVIPKKSDRSNEFKESEVKGYEFEKFVVSLFDNEYFNLLEWRSVKFHDGVFPLSCQFPDLEFFFQSTSKILHFAIECKWRQGFYKNTVNWTKESQLETYRQFETISQIPVFVMLGIGGVPNKPNEVYCIPLKEIDGTRLNSMGLKIFECIADQRSGFEDCDSILNWQIQIIKSADRIGLLQHRPKT
jgi:hypothetical protein